MMSLLGLGKNKRDVRITIEYCPKNVTLPYKVKKLINRASINVPSEDSLDPFGFKDKKIRVGECLNEKQLEHLVDIARKGHSDLDTIEIVEGSSQQDLLID
jgi:hypothetical protein